MPEHPSVSKNMHFIDWLTFASGSHPLEYAATFGIGWSVNFSQEVQNLPKLFLDGHV